LSVLAIENLQIKKILALETKLENHKKLKPKLKNTSASEGYEMAP